MARNPEKNLKLLRNRIQHSLASQNLNSFIGYVTQIVQSKKSQCHNILFKESKIIFKQTKSLEMFQDPNVSSLQRSRLPTIVFNCWQWYQKLIGMDEVDRTKQQVLNSQDRLFKIQDQRRLLTQQATSVNEKLKEIYSELIQTKRDDSKFVQLTILENKWLQGQLKVTNQLQFLEDEERDQFTKLTTAITEYHDSQAVNAQKYKYFSILASAFLAIFSLTSSIFYNNKRIMDIRNIISDMQISFENSLSQKSSEIIEKIDSQDNYIKSVIFVPNLEGKKLIIKENNENLGNISIDSLHFRQKIKQTVYYVGIVVGTLYVIQQILTG